MVNTAPSAHIWHACMYEYSGARYAWVACVLPDGLERRMPALCTSPTNKPQPASHRGMQRRPMHTPTQTPTQGGGGGAHACVDDESHAAEVRDVDVINDDDEDKCEDGEAHQPQVKVPPALLVVRLRVADLGDDPAPRREQQHRHLKKHLLMAPVVAQLHLRDVPAALSLIHI